MLLDKIILDICNYEYEYFLRKTNVQGVGLGYKVINGCTTSDKAIQVFVSKKINKEYLSNDDLIPTYYRGIQTDVTESGFFTTNNNLNLPTNGLTSRVRPVTGGYTIGPAKLRTAATYSALVTDGIKYYMLGNNHSIAYSNSLPIGYPILQPSVWDGGKIEYDMIAKLSKFIPIKPERRIITPINYVDCAMAEVLTQGTVSSNITFLGKPTGISEPSLDLEVQASCRTSTYFTAKVLAIGVTVRVNVTQIGNALFKNQFQIDFGSSIGGNSGALIMTYDKKAVGMLISGSNTISTCTPIQTVLDFLNVRLA